MIQIQIQILLDEVNLYQQIWFKPTYVISLH